jgi:hypothetical protein
MNLQAIGRVAVVAPPGLLLDVLDYFNERAQGEAPIQALDLHSNGLGITRQLSWNVSGAEEVRVKIRPIVPELQVRENCLLCNLFRLLRGSLS